MNEAAGVSTVPNITPQQTQIVRERMLLARQQEEAVERQQQYQWEVLQQERHRAAFSAETLRQRQLEEEMVS